MLTFIVAVLQLVKALSMVIVIIPPSYIRSEESLCLLHPRGSSVAGGVVGIFGEGPCVSRRQQV